jgi:hypothetical protein
MGSELYRAFIQNMRKSAEMPAAEHLPYNPDGFNQAMSNQAGAPPQTQVPPGLAQGNTSNGNWLDDPSRNVSLYRAFVDWIGGGAKAHLGNRNEDDQLKDIGINPNERYPRR